LPLLAYMLLALVQLFAVPVTSTYAQQVKKDVVISITYEVEKPIKVCTYLHDLDDPELLAPRDAHCWVPSNGVGDFDVRTGMRLDEANYEVVVTYPSKRVVIYLNQRINT